MNKIALYSRPFPRVRSFADMIDAAVELGVSAVEGSTRFELASPDVEAAKRIKEYADSKNVVIPCFSLFIDLAGDDRRERIETVKKYAEVAAALGSPFLHHTVVPEFMHPENVLPERERLFKAGVAAVREITDRVDELGLKTVFEDQGFVFNGISGFRRFLDEVGRDVGVVADLGNIYQTGCLPEEFVAEFLPEICHVHIKDILITGDNADGKGYPSLSGGFLHEVPVGITDFKKCFNLLKNAGYDGYYSLEYGAADDNDGSMRDAVETVDRLLNEA